VSVTQGANYVTKKKWEWEFLSTALQEGFTPVELPLIERFQWEQLPEQMMEMFPSRKKWLTSNGEIEMLRSDWTETASRWRQQEGAIQDPLAYVGEIFREDGSSRQFGLEVFQTPFPEAEAKTLRVIVPFLQQRIQQKPITGVVGYSNFYRFYLPQEEIEENELQEALRYKSIDQIRQLAEKRQAGRFYQPLLQLLENSPEYGENISFPEPLIPSESWANAVGEIISFSSMLQRVGVHRVLIDLGATPLRPYYEGITCQLYVPNILEPIAMGGRYRLPTNAKESSFGMAIHMPVLEQFLGMENPTC
jgi:ATP phosphoribosyltransferase regulatory subunit HisZ